MTRGARLVALGGAAMASLALSAATHPPRHESWKPQQPTFRSGANAVTVDVSVRERSGRPITGLSAADFQVFDNSVPQQVDEVSYGRLPIDITVALDVSYSVTGVLLDRLRQAVTQLTRDLRPEDRLKLVLFNMQVTRQTDYTTDVKVVEQALRDVRAAGGTALLDAISVTLVDVSPRDRRQLIVFFTDGSDSSSTTTPEVLMQVARRTKGTLTFVIGSTGRTMTVTDFRSSVPQTSITTVPSTTRPPLQGLFTTLTRETGGSILIAGPTTDLRSTFRRALEDFRSTYVLYYTPRNVEHSGYHTIEVKVNRHDAQVQARRGYFSP